MIKSKSKLKSSIEKPPSTKKTKAITAEKTEKPKKRTKKDVTASMPLPKRTTGMSKKIVKSKDVIDASIPLFTTQKKNLLEFAVKVQIPSKFVFPNIPTFHPSDLSPGFETIQTFIEREMKNYDLVGLVDRIREIQPKITKSEALFYITDVFEPDEEFFKQAANISFAYENPELFNNEKINWTTDELPKLLKKDKEDFLNITEYFTDIEEDLEPVQTSDMVITKMSIEFDVVLNNPDDILIHVAPDIFANMKASYNIPFIKYLDQFTSKYKAFAGDTFESRPPFKLFKNRFEKFVDKNTIYMIILADPGDNIQEYTKSSYIPAILNLSKNKLSFKYSLLNNRPEEEIIEFIKKALPSLNLTNRREKNYSAKFNIYNTFIREDSFLDYLISEPFIPNAKKIFSSLLFVDEFDKPVSEKKKLKLYYDTNLGFETKEQNDELSRIASLGFYMTQYQSGINDKEISKGRYKVTDFESESENKNKLIGTTDSVVKSLILETNTPYILVSISKAVNKFVLYQFMNIYSRLLTLYNESIREPFEDEYNNLIPELKNSKTVDDLTLILKPKAKSKNPTKINLAAIAPEIFTKSYSRDCQYKYQPIDINEDEIEEWKNNKIEVDGKMVERPVLQLGDYYFTCPTDVRPFVDLKQNLDEQRQYDSYPCCYATKQEKVKERKRGTSVRSGKDAIKIGKIMGEKGIATIPTPIEEILLGAFEKPIKFCRLGTLISPSSFLACICIAIDDKRFMSLKTNEEKENYINTLRVEIANKANFLVASSELFDVSEKDRMENFKKVEEYLDPSLYYRVLEEMFGLNIFIFSGSLPKPNVDTVYSLEVSRFSSIPTHSYNKNAPTLLIYKHWGAENDHLEFPQCEIIAARLDEREISLFSPDIARYLLKAYFITAEVYGKIYIPERNLFETYSSQTIYQLLERDFFVLFQNNIIQSIGQIIDEKGKLAAIQIQTKIGNMTVGVPPLPPQNLPLLTKIETPTLDAVRKIFVDEPTGYSYENDKVVSVWFRILNVEFGIQIPIEPIDKRKIQGEYRSLLASVPENRLNLIQKPSEIQRLLKLQKDVNMIIQLIRWIFLVVTKDSDLTLEERIEEAEKFLDEVIQEVPRREKDSALVYDFSLLPRKLPIKRNSLIEILKQLSETVPTFTDGRKIFISGKVFNDRVRESLIHYINLNLPNVIPDYLDGYYESTFDYPRIPKTLIFLSDVDFERWLKQAINDPTSSYPVLYSLKPRFSELNTPYLFAMDLTKPSLVNAFGQKFVSIIQNAPLEKSKESALENAIRWKQLRINRPEVVSSLDISEFTNYKVFGISPSESFEVIEDKSTGNKKETIYILKYPNSNRYAAVLPLE